MIPAKFMCFFLHRIIKNIPSAFGTPIWSEIHIGKHLIVFEKSKLLNYLSILTDAQRCDNGEFFPYQWQHYGVYTQKHIIDVVSHIEPQVYQYD